jgi:FkbM family methyltransferase
LFHSAVALYFPQYYFAKYPFVPYPKPLLMSFPELLKSRLIEESGNYFTDNYDYYSQPKKKSLLKKAINIGKRALYIKPFLSFFFKSDIIFRDIFLRMYKMDKYMAPLDYFYRTLKDENSKELLLKIVSFRILGYIKVKLPLSTPEYWTKLKEVESLASQADFIDLDTSVSKLYCHDLSKFNIPVKIFMNTKGLYTTFFVEQYKLYLDSGQSIGAEINDVVFDLGGCYGDTTLYFANQVGDKGKVYAFEFIPGNIKVMNQNFELNPQLEDQIEIVARPVWQTSGQEVYYKEAGPMSKISFEEFDGYDGKTKTISIDDFVKANNISKVDFLKTDIEGAEPFAIKGALDTLRKFRPNLAISIYHSMDDFVNIVKQINELELGYQFHLGHSTIYSSETVLFCTVG